jgi:hypothetical protein
MKIISIITTESFNPEYGYSFNIRLLNGAEIEETTYSLTCKYEELEDSILEGGANLGFLVGKEFEEEWF